METTCGQDEAVESPLEINESLTCQTEPYHAGLFEMFPSVVCDLCSPDMIILNKYKTMVCPSEYCLEETS